MSTLLRSPEKYPKKQSRKTPETRTQLRRVFAESAAPRQLPRYRARPAEASRDSRLIRHGGEHHFRGFGPHLIKLAGIEGTAEPVRNPRDAHFHGLAGRRVPTDHSRPPHRRGGRVNHSV